MEKEPKGNSLIGWEKRTRRQRTILKTAHLLGVCPRRVRPGGVNVGVTPEEEDAPEGREVLDDVLR